MPANLSLHRRDTDLVPDLPDYPLIPHSHAGDPDSLRQHYRFLPLKSSRSPITKAALAEVRSTYGKLGIRETPVIVPAALVYRLIELQAAPRQR
jgi:hypothetical protein